VVICLERGADLHMAQLMPVPLTVSCSNKIQIGFRLPVLYRLTQVVLEKGPLNGCIVVAVVVWISWSLLRCCHRRTICLVRSADITYGYRDSLTIDETFLNRCYR